MRTRFSAALLLLLAALASAVLTAPAPAAKRPDVVLLVFDELPTDSLRRADGGIDASLFPGFAALARTSTWFPNAHTVYDSTHHAVPMILDGRFPRPKVPSTSRGHPASVFDVFGRRGWRIDASEEGSSVCSRRWCPRSRKLVSKDVLRNLAAGRAHRMRAELDAIRPGGRPSFYFRHLLLPHVPWVYLPSGKRYAAPFSDQRSGFSGPRGFHDPFLAAQSRQRHLLQLRLVDAEILRLLRRLAGAGTLDRTMLVVTADHGISFDTGVDDRRRVTSANIDEVAPVPLFVKAPGQRSGRVEPALARTLDVVPTMADVLGLKLGWRRSGRSAFSARVRRRRAVRVLTRDMRRVLSVGAGRLERRRRANRRRFAAPFSHGLWGIGPHPELVGRAVATLAAGRRGPVHALMRPRGSLWLNPAAAVAPSWVTGRIRGDSRRRPRALALAVNGAIAAVGRSVRLRGSRAERFALLVPEGVLRPGPNRARLYAVRATRGGLGLRAL